MNDERFQVNKGDNTHFLSFIKIMIDQQPLTVSRFIKRFANTIKRFIYYEKASLSVAGQIKADYAQQRNDIG